MIFLYGGAIILFSWWVSWWSIVLFGLFLGRYIHKVSQVFTVGFFVPFMIWGGFAYVLDIQAESIISQRVAQLFGLGIEFSLISYVLTASLAGALGVLSFYVGYASKATVLK